MTESTETSVTETSSITSGEQTGIALDQATILQQLDEDFNRAVDSTVVTFTRAEYQEYKEAGLLRRIWPWLLLALILLLLLLLLIIIIWLVWPVPCKPECSDCIYYQLNIQAFNKDFNGLKEKLDYIEDLGAKFIVINQEILPDKYSTDFLGLHTEEIGTMSDFEGLVEAAKERKMGIIIEISLAYSLYKYHAFENKYLSLTDGEKDKREGYYDCGDIVGVYGCNFAVLDGSNDDVLSELEDIVEAWQDAGACGFQFRDLGLAHLGDGVGKDPRMLLETAASWINDERVIIADIGAADESKRSAKTFYEAGADMYLGDGLKRFVISPYEWNKETKKYATQSIKEGVTLIEAGHEVPLWMTEFTSQEYAVDIRFDYMYNNLLLLMFTLPGTPYVVSGEELMKMGHVAGEMDWKLIEKCQTETSSRECNTLNFVKNLAKMKKDGKIKSSDEVEFIDVAANEVETAEETLPEKEETPITTTERNATANSTAETPIPSPKMFKRAAGAGKKILTPPPELPPPPPLIFKRAAYTVIVNMFNAEITMDCDDLEHHVAEDKRYVVISTPASRYEVGTKMECQGPVVIGKGQGIVLGSENDKENTYKVDEASTAGDHPNSDEQDNPDDVTEVVQTAEETLPQKEETQITTERNATTNKN